VSTPTPREPERLSPGLARLLLAIAYVALVALYAWQASGRPSPTIFSDEIEFTQISRGIAEDGIPSRRGEPSSFGTLYTFLVAPVWWLDPASAWAAAKLIGVLLMTATIFPAYALARFIASRAWALGAAVAAVAAPPLAYGPYLLEEPIAYPYSTTALWAIVAATTAPSRRRIALAAALCLVAPFVRGQLAVLIPVLGAALAYLGWQTDRFTRWRRTWTVWDWIGAAVLVVGAAVAFSAAAGHRSEVWYVATGFQKRLVVENAAWALAAVTIGLAVLPVIATTAAFLSRDFRATAAGRAFVLVGTAAFVVFVGYAAGKGAYLAKYFSVDVLERNVIYLVPILMAATAAVLERGRIRPLALAGGLAVALTLVFGAELRLDRYPYFEAPSLAIAALANRNFSYTPEDVERALVLVALGSTALLAGRLLVRSRLAAVAFSVVAFFVVSTWALTAEIYAARGLNLFSERLHQSTAKPPDWVDRATGGEPTLFLGQRLVDQNAVWLLEFWNPAIQKVWSLDGTASVPTQSPDLGAPDGRLSPDPGVRWVVAGNGVEVVGEPVGEPVGAMRLFRVDPPVKYAYAQNGVDSDGWMGERASYSHFAPEDGESRGFATVSVSRRGACSAALKPAKVVVRFGTVAVRNKQPGFGRIFATEQRLLPPCGERRIVVPATVPYHVEVEVTPTFVPKEIDAGSGDVRELGAQVGFAFDPFPS
jgi:hypothetical protein